MVAEASPPLGRFPTKIFRHSGHVPKVAQGFALAAAIGAGVVLVGCGGDRSAPSEAGSSRDVEPKPCGLVFTQTYTSRVQLEAAVLTGCYGDDVDEGLHFLTAQMRECADGTTLWWNEIAWGRFGVPGQLRGDTSEDAPDSEVERCTTGASL